MTSYDDWKSTDPRDHELKPDYCEHGLHVNDRCPVCDEPEPRHNVPYVPPNSPDREARHAWEEAEQTADFKEMGLL